MKSNQKAQNKKQYQKEIQDEQGEEEVKVENGNGNGNGKIVDEIKVISNKRKADIDLSQICQQPLKFKLSDQILPGSAIDQKDKDNNNLDILNVKDTINILKALETKNEVCIQTESYQGLEVGGKVVISNPFCLMYVQRAELVQNDQNEVFGKGSQNKMVQQQPPLRQSQTINQKQSMTFFCTLVIRAENPFAPITTKKETRPHNISFTIEISVQSQNPKQTKQHLESNFIKLPPLFKIVKDKQNGIIPYSQEHQVIKMFSSNSLINEKMFNDNRLKLGLPSTTYNAEYQKSLDWLQTHQPKRKKEINEQQTQQVDSFQNLWKNHKIIKLQEMDVCFSIEKLMLVYAYFYKSKMSTVASIIFMDKNGDMMPVKFKFDKLLTTEFLPYYTKYPNSQFKAEDYKYLFMPNQQSYFFTGSAPFARPGNFGSLQRVFVDSNFQLYVTCAKQQRKDGLFQKLDKLVFNQSLSKAQRSWIQGKYEHFHQFSWKFLDTEFQQIQQNKPTDSYQQKSNVFQDVLHPPLTLFKFIGYNYFLPPKIKNAYSQNKYINEYALQQKQKIQPVLLKFAEMRAKLDVNQISNYKTTLSTEVQAIIRNNEFFSLYGQQFKAWRTDYQENNNSGEDFDDAIKQYQNSKTNLLFEGVYHLDGFNIADQEPIMIEDLDRQIGPEFLPLIIFQHFEPKAHFAQVLTSDVHLLNKNCIEDYFFLQILFRINPFENSLRILKNAYKGLSIQPSKDKKVKSGQPIVYSSLQFEKPFNRRMLQYKMMAAMIDPRTSYYPTLIGYITKQQVTDPERKNCYCVKGPFLSTYGLAPQTRIDTAFIITSNSQIPQANQAMEEEEEGLQQQESECQKANPDHQEEEQEEGGGDKVLDNSIMQVEEEEDQVDVQKNQKDQNIQSLRPDRQHENIEEEGGEGLKSINQNSNSADVIQNQIIAQQSKSPSQISQKSRQANQKKPSKQSRKNEQSLDNQSQLIHLVNQSPKEND